MATRHTFYLPPEQWHPPFILAESEAHHLSRVLRIKKGQQVRLFDGAGRYGLFSVRSIDKNTVTLDCQEEHKAPAPKTKCTLATGFSKALRRSWFLEKAVELEAHALWFWKGDYSQAALPDPNKINWSGSLIAGAKQCNNPWLPEIQLIENGIHGLIACKNQFEHCIFLYEGATNGAMFTKEDIIDYDSTLLIIGPEGGFSPQEVDALCKAGIKAVSLGRSILRWETAAILTLGIAWWARQ